MLWVLSDSGFEIIQIFQVWVLGLLFANFNYFLSFTGLLHKREKGVHSMLTLVESFWQSTPISDDNSVDFSNCFLGK